MDMLIVLGIGKEELQQQVITYLNHIGSVSISCAKDGDNLLRLTRKQSPKLIIFDPSSYGANGLKISKILLREKIAPVIFITTQAIHKQIIEELINKEAYASTYLPTQFTMEQLRIAVTTTLASFKKINELEQKIITLNEKLAEKKKINKAKELLIKTKGWSEPEAHRYLQKQSMNTGLPLKKVAQVILDNA